MLYVQPLSMFTTKYFSLNMACLHHTCGFKGAVNKTLSSK